MKLTKDKLKSIIREVIAENKKNSMILRKKINKRTKKNDFIFF